MAGEYSGDGDGGGAAGEKRREELLVRSITPVVVVAIFGCG